MTESSNPLTTPQLLHRRQFVARSTAATLGGLLAAQAIADESSDRNLVAHQAMGTKVGEVSDASAILWARFTAGPTRNTTGPMIEGRGAIVTSHPPIDDVNELAGACPGMPGRIRLRYGKCGDLSDARVTDWAQISAESDFSHQFQLDSLKPATVYHYATETSDPSGREVHAPFQGRFETAPLADEPFDFTFCVITCLMYTERDPGDDEGFNIFPVMQWMSPKFVAFTGDNVYYDNEAPRAVTPELARYTSRG